jgi:hypothetical protein
LGNNRKIIGTSVQDNMQVETLLDLISILKEELTAKLNSVEDNEQNIDAVSEMDDIINRFIIIKAQLGTNTKKRKRSTFEKVFTLSSTDAENEINEIDEIDEIVAEKKKFIPDSISKISEEEYIIPEVSLRGSHPVCLNLFCIDRFKEFLSLRNQLDAHITKSKLSLQQIPAELWKNKHIVAYFFSKISLKIKTTQQRADLVKKIWPKFKFSPSALIYLKQWGNTLLQGENYQWMAGIDYKTLSTSSINSWRLLLMKINNKNWYTTTTIEDVEYVIPLVIK